MLLMGMQNNVATLQHILAVTYKVKNNLQYDQTSSFLSIYLSVIKIFGYTYTYIKIFMEAAASFLSLLFSFYSHTYYIWKFPG